MDIDYDLPYGFLRLYKVVVEHRNQAVVERSLQILKDHVEAIKDDVGAG